MRAVCESLGLSIPSARVHESRPGAKPAPAPTAYRVPEPLRKVEEPPGPLSRSRASTGFSQKFPMGSEIGAERVVAVDRLLQASAIDVGIDLGGRDVGVTEHLLHRAKVRPPLQQVGRKGVAKLVR